MSVQGKMKFWDLLSLQLPFNWTYNWATRILGTGAENSSITIFIITLLVIDQAKTPSSDLTCSHAWPGYLYSRLYIKHLHTHGDTNVHVLSNHRSNGVVNEANLTFLKIKCAIAHWWIHCTQFAGTKQYLQVEQRENLKHNNLLCILVQNSKVKTS